MEKQIITGPLDIAQRIALEEYMYNKIKDAMRYDGKCVAWYELSEMSDFFDIDELWDDNGKQCDVLDTEERRYMMDDENEWDIRSAFVNARDRACREKIKEDNPILGAMLYGI
ncbi:MAG: hypothetical protein IJK22_07285 [Bacteroidales bacterium]|nr:hypothetical protein [Bacteroidales bacterium]